MTDLAVRPFRIDVPEEELVDLRRPVAATRWPDRETVTDQSQGVQLAKIQPLVRYWGTEYDWRKDARRRHALLAHEHRGVFLAVLLGGMGAQPLQRRGHLDPCCRDG